MATEVIRHQDGGPLAKTALSCSVGVMAYNEEANIGRLLRALLDQRATTCEIKEIIVLASGCTDGTTRIARRFSALDPRIRLIEEERREGKASAVNLFLRHSGADILVSVGADTVPAEDAIQRLLEPFVDPEVGMTGGRPVPVNDPDTFMGFAAHLLWELHHQIALRSPKLGELTAYRRVFHRIPQYSSVDEANMEPLIRGQGFRLQYVPRAIVYNRGPETVEDFLKQRRRIYAGHLRMAKEQGYAVSTMSVSSILAALLRVAVSRVLRGDRHFFSWAPKVIWLELKGRAFGWLDFRRKRDHAVWDIAVTTKEAIK